MDVEDIKDEEELLDMNFCHCGTVREVIDEAIDAAISLKDEGKCAVWQQTKAILTVQMLANIFGLIEHGKNGPEQGKENTKEFMDDMGEQTGQIMRQAKDHIKLRLIEKITDRVAQEAKNEYVGAGHRLQ